MLRPVKLTINWSGNHDTLDAVDQSSAIASQFNCPGVYVHLSKDSSGNPICRYLGKHTSSLSGRQFEHFTNMFDGKYNLYGKSGKLIFKAGDGNPSIDDLDEYLSITSIYFGTIDKYPSFPVDSWVACIESLLMRSQKWSSHSGTILNYRLEPPRYQMFSEFEIIHSNNSDMQSLFGSSTKWDKKTKSIF